MNRLRTFVVMALFLALSGVGQSALAQRPTRRSAVRPGQLIQRIQDDSYRFTESLNQALTQSGYDYSQDNNSIEAYIRDFQAATDHLRDHFDRQENVPDAVADLLNRAGAIDTFLRNTRTNQRVQQNWATLRADLDQLAGAYNVSWSWDNNYNNGRNGQNGSYNNGRTDVRSKNGYGNIRLTGTYRLDTSRSDNPRDAAYRAMGTQGSRNRDEIYNNISARLQAPDTISIDQQGQHFTLASSKGNKFSFDADGRERTETISNNRTVQATATVYGDQLTINTRGSRGSDYTVTFEPLDNGRTLRVVRQIYDENLRQPISVKSIYTKTSNTPQFDVYTNTGDYRGDSGGNRSRRDYVIPNGTIVVASLDASLNSEQAREGDHFTMTVVSPERYSGAIINGYVSSINPSGRVSGRSTMALNFQDIRFRDGSTHSFAGNITDISTPNGDRILVDQEGQVRDQNSQTNTTLERGGIGAGIGAIIGAIAGGGKGAAIGAVVGGGIGAGSVYVQGSQNLHLPSGTQVTINTAAPNY